MGQRAIRTSADDATALTPEEAFAVLEPCYDAVRAIFLEEGLALLTRTRLECRSWVHDSPRHYGACAPDGRRIVVAPGLADLPTVTVFAILAHELGHAADFQYPARFALGPDGSAQDRGADVATRDEQQWRRWLRGWKQRSDDDIEYAADAIAGAVMGTPIGYCGPCHLQCFHGAPRPAGLR